MRTVDSVQLNQRALQLFAVNRGSQSVKTERQTAFKLGLICSTPRQLLGERSDILLSFDIFVEDFVIASGLTKKGKIAR